MKAINIETMKQTSLILLVVLSLFVTRPLAVSAADSGEFDLDDPMAPTSNFSALFGYTNIAGQDFIGARFQPELSIGKIGFGLDVPVMFNLSTGKLRTDEFKDGVGYLRMIRYLSWGRKKQDDFYIKVGDISGAYLGYGMLINNYSNSISFDKRKIGTELDYCWKDFLGIEVVYSDFNMTSLNLLGVRPYVKPLGFTGIPILKTWDIGLNLVTDHDKTGPLVASDPTSANNYFFGNGGSMTGLALDMGVTLVNMSSMRLVLFSSGAMLVKNTSPNFEAALIDSIQHGTTDFYQKAQTYGDGYGISVGFDYRFKILGNLLRMDTRLERMWYTDNFIPQFFDYSYEVNKDARLLSLVTAEEKAGIYGNLGFSVLDKIRVSGSLMLPDNLDETNPALLKLELDASKVLDKVVLTGTYLKGGLTTLDDALKLDDRSLMYVRVAYKVFPFVVTGVDYRWTWATNVDGQFIASSSWTPYVGLSFDLPFIK
jgi:hypothetical protein